MKAEGAEGARLATAEGSAGSPSRSLRSLKEVLNLFQTHFFLKEEVAQSSEATSEACGRLPSAVLDHR